MVCFWLTTQMSDLLLSKEGHGMLEQWWIIIVVSFYRESQPAQMLGCVGRVEDSRKRRSRLKAGGKAQVSNSYIHTACHNKGKQEVDPTNNTTSGYLVTGYTTPYTTWHGPH